MGRLEERRGQRLADLDVWSGIPLFLGGVIVLSGTDERGPLQVSLVLVVFGWPAMVRVLRASVLEARRRDYVTAVRVWGPGRPACCYGTSSRTARAR